MPPFTTNFLAIHLGEPDDIRERVRRNLDRLFNTRQRDADPGDDPRVATTLLGYGMPDLSKIDMGDPVSRQMVVETIYRLVTRWEPRLTDIEVIPGSSEPGGEAQIRIEAQWAGGAVGFDARIKQPGHFTLE